jgi:hypothetical protein
MKSITVHARVQYQPDNIQAKLHDLEGAPFLDTGDEIDADFFKCSSKDPNCYPDIFIGLKMGGTLIDLSKYGV